MRKTLYLVVALAALSAVAMAQMSCPTKINVYPGEWIQLNGTSIPKDPSNVTKIYYSWTFDGTVYNATNGAVVEPVTTAKTAFWAPLKSDTCIKAYLTVTYERNVTGSTLTETCVNMTCIEICTQKYKCPACSDIFCDNSSSQAAACGGTPMSFTSCPCKICFTNWTAGMVLNWTVDGTVLTDNAYVDFTNSPSTNTSCVLIDWVGAKYQNATHIVRLKVYGPPTYSSDVFNCTVGNTTLVEIPKAQITRGS